MNFEDSVKRIEKLIKAEYLRPIIVDVQNRKDLSALCSYFGVGTNKIIDASDFANPDDLPHWENLYQFLSHSKDNVFLKNITSFLLTQGEHFLLQSLKEILSLQVAGHVIIFTYQCSMYFQTLTSHDLRMKDQIIIVDGDKEDIPRIVLMPTTLPPQSNWNVVKGLNSIADAIETGTASKVYVKTNKPISYFKNSIISIKDVKSAYEILSKKRARLSF